MRIIERVEVVRRERVRVRDHHTFPGKLPTHRSPKPTLTLTSHLGQNVGLGEGRWAVPLKRVMIQGKCEAEGKDNSEGHGVGVGKGKVRVQEGKSKGQYKGEVGGGG